VLRAYGLDKLHFGPEYLIPKPLDPRVPLRVAPAIAGAAMASGVARRSIDLVVYAQELANRLTPGRAVMGVVIQKAQASPRRVVFSEGEERKIIRAAIRLQEEGIATPILLGREAVVHALLEEMRIDGNLDIVDPAGSHRLDAYAAALHEQRARKGVTLREAREQLGHPNAFGAMMVRSGDADAFVAGLTYHYPDVIRPALQIIGAAAGVSRVAGLYLMVAPDGRVVLLSDPTVNVDPTAEEVAGIALMAADRAREFDIEPRLALLSYSNFGSTPDARTAKMARAAALVKARQPDLVVDGEMMADVALSPEMRRDDYPFSTLTGEANVLIFPSLESANVAYKLLQHLGGAVAVGPILMGMARPVHVLSRGVDVPDIVNMAAVAVVDAQNVALRERRSG
jgi:malate dehydrogenase (oxaloacetate-decarboxylating)(NADP+)